MNRHKFRVVLAGNPNCGKTTIFNLLTGAHQHVGNYPGVTVERKTGRFFIGELEIELIDLPGVYGLSSSSPEECVAFRELMEARADLILDVVDAGNPQRNLYLTTQLSELNCPMILVFNMADDAAKRGLAINYAMLERFFGARVLPTVGTSGEGMTELKTAIARILSAPERPLPRELSYGDHTDAAIARLTAAIKTAGVPAACRWVPVRYFAIKLLENDETICAMPDFAPFLALAAELRAAHAAHVGMNQDTFMADRRYGVIAGACREAISISNERRRQLSDKIDKIATDRLLGVPIFLLAMYMVFTFTFVGAEPFCRLLEFLFDHLAAAINANWPVGHLEALRDLIVRGIIGGVGGVLVFLPNILLLFLAIAFLEGTGYMARAAFVMDGFMHKFGLHGKSFIPMLLGFGCTVPAVLATRTIESTRDRLATIMVLPLMSCGARLPIYALLIPAFFSERYQALLMWVIYTVGIVLALVFVALLKRTVFSGGDEVFVMELPPYRMPTLQSLLIHMFERTAMYLSKAGTIILGASVILYCINTYPAPPAAEKAEFSAAFAAIAGSTAAAELKTVQLEHLRAEQETRRFSHTIAGHIGRTLEPVLAPAGFDWRISSALIGAFAAKELFVSQLGILFSVPEGGEVAGVGLRERLRENYTPLQALAIMLFCLIAMPCIATVAVVRRETGSWKLTLLQLGGLTLTAYVVALAVYQFGLLLNIGTQVINQGGL